MQKAFDELYQQSKNGNNFYKLLEIIGSEQNICLAYRNLKTNSGSKTVGTDGKTIEDNIAFISEEIWQAVMTEDISETIKIMKKFNMDDKQRRRFNRLRENYGLLPIKKR